MKRTLLIVLLTAGVFAGFGSGFARMHQYRHGFRGCDGHRQAFSEWQRPSRAPEPLPQAAPTPVAPLVAPMVAPMAAPAPTIIVIGAGASIPNTPSVITVPIPAAAPASAPAP